MHRACIAVLLLVCAVSLSEGRSLPFGSDPLLLNSDPPCPNTVLWNGSALLTSLSTFTTSGVAIDVAPAKVLPPFGVPGQLLGSGVGPASSSGEPGPSKGSCCGDGCNFEPTAPHKPLLPNISRSDVLLLVLTAITLFIAAGGGIGGGAVFVVLYVFVGGFTAPQAVALSNITILGGSLANFIANTARRHPVLDGPLIDWDLIMVMEPTTMLGALLGGYLNKLFPVWLTSCLLAALLSLLTWKLLKRGTSTFKAETRQQLQRRLQHLDDQKQQQQQHVRDGSAAAALRQPLLMAGGDDDGADAAAHGDAGGRHAGLVKLDQLTGVDHAGAWFDCIGAGDQSPAPFQHLQQQRHHQQYVPPVPAEAAGADAAHALIVIPVPGHLRPLNVTTQQQHLLAEQKQQQQRSTPRSACSSTPGSALSPQLLVRSATAAAPAAPAGHSSQVALLLQPYSSAAVGPVSSSSRAGSRCLSCFSCFNAAKLRLATIQAYERQQLPCQPLLTLFFLSCWVVGSDTLKVTLQCGSLGYWIVVVSVIPPAVLVTLLVREWLLTKTAVKEAAAAAAAAGGVYRAAGECPEYEAASPPPAAAAAAGSAVAAGGSGGWAGGIHWTPKNSLLYPLLCSAAGVVAGLFGVGGGIVKGPLMLELGVLPEVAAATSATMIMFTAGSAAVVYINFGGVVTDYALALLALGFFVTLLGQLFTVRLVKALGRRSIIIFMMGTLMTLATVAASYQSVVAVAAARQHLWNWGSICKQT